MADEQVFFQDAGMRVTQARLMVHGQTYAMSGITSVRAETRSPNPIGQIILIVLGAILILSAFVPHKQPSSLTSIVILALVGIALVGFGILLATRLERSHAIVLTSASGELRVLTSNESSTYLMRHRGYQ